MKARVGEATNVRRCGCQTLPKRRKRSHVRIYVCPQCVHRTDWPTS